MMNKCKRPNLHPLLGLKDRWKLSCTLFDYVNIHPGQCSPEALSFILPLKEKYFFQRNEVNATHNFKNHLYPIPV